jgi:acetyl-CoA synthetase
MSRVCIYMSMVVEAVVAMLACARIGAVHSVVFAGFSSDALADRLLDAKAEVLICCSEAIRGPKHIPLKLIVDEALLRCPHVRSVLVHKSTHASVPMKSGRDEDLIAAMAAERPYCPITPMDSEDPLFMLYTSGSTGKPKGVLHTTAGYLLYAAMTHHIVFDVHPERGDVYACMADIGWITGHSYIVYGPLCNGSSTFLFEGLPTSPDAGRYWDMVQRHKINVLYTAPTAIRTLMRHGDEYVTKYDRSSLRVLGSVGEPINPACWEWYFNVVGNKKAAVVDTFWQTETGGHMLTPLPAATPTKPGSCTLPFFGIEPVILDAHTGAVLSGEARGVLAIARPWPSMARTVYGDHGRYMSTYLNPYKGFYFTGDGAYRDKDGYFWIAGRVDDVMNVSGHRLGTMEIESALVSHPACSEAAVVPIPHDIKGQAIVAFATLKEGYEDSDVSAVASELKQQVRHVISPIATPDYLFVVQSLPKTRSGKIMRRILRKIAEGLSSELGDISTLADPAVVEQIIKIVAPSIPQK